MIDAIRDLIRYDGLSGAAQYLRKDLKLYEEARDKWLKAAESAKDAYDYFEYERGKEETEKNSGDNVKFQIAVPEDFSDEKIEENYKTVANMEPSLHLKGTEFMEYNDSKVLEGQIKGLPKREIREP